MNVVKAYRRGEPQITQEKLQLAKALSFWLVYGQSAEAIVRYAKTRYGFEINEKQVAKTRALFFKHHDGLARWHAKAWDEVECTEVVEGRTILGRRRLIQQLGLLSIQNKPGCSRRLRGRNETGFVRDL